MLGVAIVTVVELAELREQVLLARRQLVLEVLHGALGLHLVQLRVQLLHADLPRLRHAAAPARPSPAAAPALLAQLPTRFLCRYLRSTNRTKSKTLPPQTTVVSRAYYAPLATTRGVSAAPPRPARSMSVQGLSVEGGGGWT
jgi:hypothetical protein